MMQCLRDSESSGGGSGYHAQIKLISKTTDIQDRGQRGSNKTITEGIATLYLAAVGTQFRLKFVVSQDKRNTI